MMRSFQILAAIAMIGIGVPSLISMPEYSYVFTWYAEPELQTKVGQEFQSCTTWSSWGDQTPYVNYTFFIECSSGAHLSYSEHYGENCYDGWDNDGDYVSDLEDPDCRAAP